jgi:DNA-binding CsgD family transcriptional regulator
MLEESGRRLFGRDSELASIRSFLTSLTGGGSARVLVGEEGSGKTRLLDATARMADTSGYRVLASEGSLPEAEIAFSGLHKLLLPLLDDLSGLSAPHRKALASIFGIEIAPVPTHLVACTAVLSLLTAVSADRPVVLLVDDFHRIDRSTATTLSFVARRLHQSRIGVLATLPTSDSRFSEWIDWPEIPVGRLGRRDAERLLSSVASDLDSSARTALLEQADGNPLALLELLGGVRENPQQSSNGFRTVLPLSLPSSLPSSERLTTAFARPLDELPERTRRALLLIALDQTGDLRSLAQAGLTLDDLGPAEPAGMIIVELDSCRARFRHPLVRAAVVAKASSAERGRAHRALASRQDDLERRAFHLAQATIGPDEETASLLERAAEAALVRGESSAATDTLIEAARFSPDPTDQRRRRARAAFLAGDLAWSRARRSGLLDAVTGMAGGSPGSLYAAVATAVDSLEQGGNVGAVCGAIRDAVANSPHTWDSSNVELIETMNSWILFCWMAGSQEHWQDFFRCLARLEPRVPEPLRTLSIACADTVRAGGLGRTRVERMLTELHDTDDSNYVLQLNTAAMYLDLLAPGRSAARRLVETGRAGPATLTYIRALGQLCLYDFGAGQWQEAQELADEGVSAAARVENQPMLGMSYYLEALLAGVRGDVRESIDWSRRLDGVAARLGALGLQRFGNHARALAAVGQGDWEQAYLQASELNPAGAFAPYVPHALWVSYDLVESAIRTGRLREGRAHQAAMVAARVPVLSPRLALLTEAAAGLVDTANWNESFQRALAVPHAEEWPFDFARVQLAYGSRLRRERRAAESRIILHLSLETFERLGAQPWTVRARNELRVAGERVGLEADAQLTPQEFVVAELAAEGFSNRQIGERLILSPRTVSGHLYRIFPKLGIVSRSALRDALLKAPGPGIAAGRR